MINSLVIVLIIVMLLLIAFMVYMAIDAGDDITKLVQENENLQKQATDLENDCKLWRDNFFDLLKTQRVEEKWDN